MRKTRQLVTYALLFVLSTLLLKALLPSTGLNDCNEFAHIHRFTLSKLSTNTSSVPVISTSGESHDDDDNCHAAQSLFSASLLPVQVFVWENPIPKVNFKYVLKLESRFKSPDLETPRRPPRDA
ncbi:MAG: hypothetical protein JSU04_11465 [Bdellovibrionales bacterium]|nr:hypothetical protein [Bdellovibrionales bacterium]